MEYQLGMLITLILSKGSQLKFIFRDIYLLKLTISNHKLINNQNTTLLHQILIIQKFPFQIQLEIEDQSKINHLSLVS